MSMRCLNVLELCSECTITFTPITLFTGLSGCLLSSESVYVTWNEMDYYPNSTLYECFCDDDDFSLDFWIGVELRFEEKDECTIESA